METKLKIILLAGPTASGKSKIAISLSKLLNGEIINADSMQIYKEIRILSSRPSLIDEKKIKHHLYGFKSVKNNFSSGQWLKLVTKKIKEILKRKRTPIIVGGTGLYFKILIDGLVKIPKIPIKFRNKIRKKQEKDGQVEFYKKLIKIDPLSKKNISPQDTQRSIRAYEVKKYTKKSIFKWIENTKPNFDQTLFKKFFLNPSRECLIDKINKRSNQMFNRGVKKEVLNFLKLKVKKNASSHKIIGIKEISNYLNRTLSLNEAKELIKIKTRQYAKRQFTWARGKMTSWEIINTSNHKEILKKVVN